ncbi:MAG: twin-arginine translocase subunit TatC [bacterium]|nr:twin-arginine translocase subunit TatC [bacterium]
MEIYCPWIENKREKVYISYYYLLFVFFYIGVFFAYFVVLPIGTQFLMGFGTEDIVPMLSVSRYLSFVIRILLAFGIVFQLPIVILFLTKIGVLAPQFLVKNRKYAILLIFIVAAIITPPDIITQVLVGIPLIILYEISILVSKLVRKKPVMDTEEDEI